MERRSSSGLALLAVVLACALLGGLPRTARAVPVEPPDQATGATVARIVAPTRIRPKLKIPEKFEVLGPQTTWSRHPTMLMVLRSAEHEGKQWLRLRLASRPNGSTAWIRRDKVLLGHTDYWIKVGLKNRTVRVFRKGRRVRKFRAVIGAPATPTPRGLGAIYEKNRQTDRNGFIGPWALSLTFHSRVLENYGGGPGRIAIHGRGGASFDDPLGTARSHGCIRVPNRNIRWLAQKVPVGTPVQVAAEQ